MSDANITSPTQPEAPASARQKTFGPGPRHEWKMADLDRFNHAQTRIVALMDTNPKVSGKAHELWACYLGDPTVAEFFRGAREIADKGKVRADIRYNLARGFIKLVDLNGDDFEPAG